MLGVEEGREFRFRGDMYSQESNFPLVMVYFGALSPITRTQRKKSMSSLSKVTQVYYWLYMDISS